MSPFALRWATRLLVAACSLKALAGVFLGDGYVLSRVVSACMVLGVVFAVAAAKHAPALIFAAIGSMYASTPLGFHDVHFWMPIPGLLCFVAMDTPRPSPRFRRALRAIGYAGLTVAALTLVTDHGLGTAPSAWGEFSAALLLVVGLIAIYTLAVRSWEGMGLSDWALSAGIGPWLLLAFVTLVVPQTIPWVVRNEVRDVFIAWLCVAPIGFALIESYRRISTGRIAS